MALRDRQISGIPLTRGQASVLAILMTALIPVLAYGLWFRTLFAWFPEELRLPTVVVGMIVHFFLSVSMVPNNVERNLLWFGSYTGASFPNGICLIPRLPIPFVLLLLRVALPDEMYRKIFWSLEGDVSIRSIRVPYEATGLSRDGARVQVKGTLRVEVANAATFRSQTVDGKEDLVQMIAAEYAAAVKSSVIAQHATAELMRGYHSAGSRVLIEWMTQAWNLIHVFGVELASAPLVDVEILSKDVERAFDRVQAKELFTQSGEAVAEAWAAFRKKNPHLSEEIAWSMFAASQGLAPGTSINIVKLK